MPHNLLCKVALITAIDSEDGDLLAEFLLGQNYAVHGIQRSASTCYGQVRPQVRPGVILHTGDLSDTNSLMRIIQDTQPDEIYSLSGFVQASSAELYLLDIVAQRTIEEFESPADAECF